MTYKNNKNLKTNLKTKEEIKMKKQSRILVFTAVMAMGIGNLFGVDVKEASGVEKSEVKVTEDYLVTEVTEDEIVADIIKGLYLDKSHKEFESLKDVTPGKIIQVTYSEEDYLNGNLENVDIEIIKEFVEEEFILTEVTSEKIIGEITKSPENNGEGIYLDENYKGWETLKGAKLGDKIKVTYNKDDYFNSVWDNIVKIEFIN